MDRIVSRPFPRSEHNREASQGSYEYRGKAHNRLSQEFDLCTLEQTHRINPPAFRDLFVRRGRTIVMAMREDCVSFFSSFLFQWYSCNSDGTMPGCRHWI